MLTLSIENKKRNLLFANVQTLAKQLLGCESLHTFVSNFNSSLKNMSTGTQGKADSYYYAVVENEWTNDMCVHVKHRKTQGKDETIFIISK